MTRSDCVPTHHPPHHLSSGNHHIRSLPLRKLAACHHQPPCIAANSVTRITLARELDPLSVCKATSLTAA